MSEMVIYQAEDGHIRLDVNLVNETLWLSQQQMAELFGIQRQAITKHLKNIFNINELQENSVCSILERMACQGYSLKIIKKSYRSCCKMCNNCFCSQEAMKEAMAHRI